MLDDAVFRRFSEFTAFSPDDVARIRKMARGPSRYRRLDVIRREGSEPDSLYVLIDGWVASSTVLANGRRLIFEIHLPGDLMGTTSVCTATAVDTLTALTPATVSRIPIDQFSEAFMSWPRFAGAMLLSCQLERVVMMDRLVAVGRTPAAARFAALLLDLQERLDNGARTAAGPLDLWITQEDIADYLGLTAVHVNRVFRQLVGEGIITRSRQHIVINDPHRLEALAMRPKRTPMAQMTLLQTAPGDRG